MADLLYDVVAVNDSGSPTQILSTGLPIRLALAYQAGYIEAGNFLAVVVQHGQLAQEDVKKPPRRFRVLVSCDSGKKLLSKGVWTKKDAKRWVRTWSHPNARAEVVEETEA